MLEIHSCANMLFSICAYSVESGDNILVLCLLTSIVSQASMLGDVPTGDIQEVLGYEEKVSHKKQYSMDNAIEDKICDIYDLYTQVLLLTNYSCSQYYK